MKIANSAIAGVSSASFLLAISICFLPHKGTAKVAPPFRLSGGVEVLACWDFETEFDLVAGYPGELRGEARFSPGADDGFGRSLDTSALGEGTAFLVGDVAFLNRAAGIDAISITYSPADRRPLECGDCAGRRPDRNHQHGKPVRRLRSPSLGLAGEF